MTDADRTLARRAGRGDRRALLELYARYRSRLYGFLVRAVGDPVLAEDVFQEVWIKVMQGIGTYRPREASFRAWLFRVASNAAVDRLRRESVRAAEELDAPVDEGTQRRIDRLASPDPGPERRGAGSFFAVDLGVALRRLSEAQRTAVLLRHQQGMSYPEIARALSVAEGTAKTLVHRGVKRLRHELAGWNPQEADHGP